MEHEAPGPVGLYAPFAIGAGLIALSAISSAKDGELITGKVGRNLDLAAGQRAAERAARNLLAVLFEAVGGDPSRIERLLMVRGYVNAADDFTLVHKVVDAASGVLIAALGEKGRHARTALGCATLPNGNAVTLEAIALLRANGAGDNGKKRPPADGPPASASLYLRPSGCETTRSALNPAFLPNPSCSIRIGALSAGVGCAPFIHRVGGAASYQVRIHRRPTFF